MSLPSSWKRDAASSWLVCVDEETGSEEGGGEKGEGGEEEEGDQEEKRKRRAEGRTVML